MRVLVVVLVIAALVGALFATQWFASDGEAPSPPANFGTSHGDGHKPAASAPGLPPGTVASRAHVEPTIAEDVANAPTTCIQVLDHGTGKPVLGAAVRRVQSGAELAFTDEKGLANLPLRNPEQLAVVLDGYLLRLVPAQLGSTEKDPQQVRLVRDEWSPRRRLQFVTSAGEAVPEAFVRLRPRQLATNPAPPVPQEDAVVRRAWTEHTMLAARPVCADVAVQLGSFDENRVHRLADGSEVRFLLPGDYIVEAATTTGLVARCDLRIEKANANAARIEFATGAFVEGVVVGLEGSAAIAGAEIVLQGGDPLGLVTTTGKDGTFRFGPLLPGPVTLHVRHDGSEPLAHGPITAPVAGLRIVLQPLPKTTLRGRVRSRAGLQPIAGATVVWVVDSGGATKASTGADGTFVLAATGSRAARLLVQAPGHVQLSELVEPGAAFQDYDLWPADTSVRLQHGMTAVLEGVVVDADGRPLAGVNVRWRPAQASSSAGFQGRRNLDGATLQLPLVTGTGPDGAFRLETDQFGAGRLLLADGTGGALDTTAIAGKTTNNLRLQR